MARKYNLISELYDRTCKTVVANPQNWQNFLQSACRNYKLRYDEQLLIYAQRPDAMGDCTGSKKQYSFRLTNENSTEVHLFECAIDLLSFATLARIEGEDWRKLNLVSLSGVYSPKQEMEKSKVPVTLQKLLEKNPQISRIVLHFDNDIAGRKAAKTLEILLKDRYEVVDEPPQRGKDFNDFLCIQLGILKQNERSFER